MPLCWIEVRLKKTTKIHRMRNLELVPFLEELVHETDKLVNAKFTGPFLLSLAAI